ncbi:amidase domain-containing protein [Tumebacillus sp. DT12]|uniref:Amidase domain-containing protein n=1 Tax=Tumebacillus lacus TaxID=2995335 RepID=A0ABT3WZX6_9BACL|nr:amidase domain-containing protein [Tumebacillus lacus]MCX7570204.1 amidase domain-containing protein [Tumebacillus lacus]
MKSKVVLTTVITTSLLTTHAYAGSYTSSNVYANSQYDRVKAKAYAEQYALTANNSGYFNYTDYGGDCTNFISQVLFHGGLPEQKVINGTIGQVDPYWWDNWFYDGKDIPNRSTSWTGAHDFRFHWANVNNIGKNRAYKYTVYTYQQAYDNFSQIYSDLWPGDIVQYVNDNGDTWHGQVVHRYDEYGNLFVAQHTYNAKDLSLKGRIKSRLDIGDKGWFVTYRIKATS